MIKGKEAAMFFIDEISELRVCRRCESTVDISQLVRHGRKRNKGTTYSCRDKKACTKIFQKLKWDREMASLKREAERAWHILVDSVMMEEANRELSLSEGDYLRPNYFMEHSGLGDEFKLSEDKIYRFTCGGIYDDNGVFLDLNLHEVTETRGVKMIQPIGNSFYFDAYSYCYHHISRPYQCLDINGSNKHPIENFFYNDSFHRQCKTCYDFYKNKRDNERKKTKNAMAFIKTMRKVKSGK
jgi:hypothetical protein